MEKVYNKLVRDNIPQIIQNDGETPVIRILKDDEYKQELFKKLEEETQEVLKTSSQEELIEELADLYEVMTSIIELENESMDKIVEVSKTKRLKRGSFTKKIFLEKTIKED